MVLSQVDSIFVYYGLPSFEYMLLDVLFSSLANAFSDRFIVFQEKEE